MHCFANLRRATVLVAGLSMLIFMRSEGGAQEQKDMPETTMMNAEQFEGWMTAEQQKFATRQESPLVLETALMRRLREDKYVTDDAIMALVMAWLRHESPPVDAQQDRGGVPFVNSKRIIGELMLFTYGRPSLKAKLHEANALVLRTVGARQQEARELEQALAILSQSHGDIDKRRVTATIYLAANLYQSGDKQKADDLYSEAVGYPWYKVKEPATRAFWDLHIAAARGVINVRRNNLAALKRLYLAPTTRSVVGPELNAAIIEAGGKVDTEGHESATP